MDIAIQSPSCFKEFFHTHSLKKSCFFLFLIVIILITAMGTLTMMVIFVLKPQKPIFSLRTVSLDSYKLDVYSNSSLLVSSVVSLSLNAQNPNKIGIKYSRSRMHIFSEDMVMGSIRVPEFYQPAHSTNISVPTRVLFHCVNISQILSSVSDVSSHTLAKIRILGDFNARIQVFCITLPMVKVALECDINIDDRSLTVSNAAHDIGAVKTQLTSFPSYAQSFSSNCSIGLYI